MEEKKEKKSKIKKIGFDIAVMCVIALVFTLLHGVSRWNCARNTFANSPVDLTQYVSVMQQTDAKGHGELMRYRTKLDEEGARAAIEEYNKTATPSEDAYIDTTTETIHDEVYGNVIDTDTLIADYYRLTEDETKICSIDVEDYFVEPSVTASDLENTLERYKALNSWSVSYNGLDDVLTVPEGAVVIEDNEVKIVDDEFIIEFAYDVVDSWFTTKGLVNDFTTHNGETISIEGGTYGNVVDVEAEIEFLKNAFYAGMSIDNRDPIYLVEEHSLTSSYVEVSIADQHVWVYINGKLKMDSDCVTGSVAAKNDTPKGVYSVYAVTRDATLKPKGATKGSFVRYWMPFTPDGCGLHDASWRNSFGGDIYKTNGSHGCVNLPRDFAEDLFDVAYVGMPVVVY